MSCTRSKIVSQARSWIGCKESDGSHKKIIDVYNSHKPLARGYAVKYTDAWCATFVSAVAIAVGCTDIIPTECSCTRMIDLFKKLGSWDESDSRTPNPGDIIFYDWEDSGSGDNVGSSDHVGIVESVVSNAIVVIEGNYSNSVKRRYININGKYIRGYGVPKYDDETEEEKPVVKNDSVTVPQLANGSEGDTVKALQILLIGYGFSCGSWGADGDFGSATDKAVRAYQNANGLEADGVVGPKTWAKLLGV